MLSTYKNHPIAKSIASCLLLLALSACDGDARPLVEAVEANEIDLASIVIQPPANSLEPLFISPGDSLQFSILGATMDGSLVAVSGNDRRWVSSNESVATVNKNGVVVGRGSGSVTIGVRVAGSVAVAFPLEVSDAVIQSISSIDGNNGDNTLSSCLPVNFSAVGNFGGNDLRALSGVTWRVDNDSQMMGAQVFQGSSTPVGAISLVGRQPAGNGVPDIVLTAILAADEDTGQPQLSLSRRFEVNDTLASLVLTPGTIRVEEGSTAQLLATATYSDRTGNFSVTEGVDWTVQTGSGVASVGTSGANPGRVTGRTMGTATVTAFCGNRMANAEVVVEDSSGSLSFNRSGTLTLDLVNDQVFDELQVSTGDVFSSVRDVSDEADWSSSDVSVVTVDSSGDDRGTLTLAGEGTAIITAEFNDIEIEIDVTVENDFDFSIGSNQ